MTKFTIGIIAVFLLVLAGAIIRDIKKEKNQKYNLKHSVGAYLFLAPALLLIVLFVIQPIVMSLWYAFTDYYLLEPHNINFVGLDNFKTLFRDFGARGDFYNAIKNTAYFVVLVLPIQIGAALGLAVLLNRLGERKVGGFFKVAYFSPVVMSLTVVSLLWLNLLRPDNLGLINSILVKFGMEPQRFLQDPSQAMNWIILISAWQGAGFQMLIFLAGLKNIPKDIVEAAELDGCNKWNVFRHITLPSIKPTFVFVFITTLIGASKLMVQPMVMTGYKDYTVSMSYYIYMEGYYFKMVGYASAAALLMTIMVGGVTLLQRRLLKED